MQIGSEKWQNVLIEGAAQMQIKLTPDICSKLTIFAQQLQTWSIKINLTAIRDPYQMAVKHFLDSMAPVALLPPNSRLLDMGAGAGFPGLPLKILRPDLTVILIDSVRKKVSFMQQIIRMLDLENTAALHLRAEALDSTAPGPDWLPRRFDVVVARALTDLSAFIELALPVLAENGKMIALKGRLKPAESAAAQAYLDSVATESSCGKDKWDFSVDRYQLPFSGDRRCIVSIERR